MNTGTRPGIIMLILLVGLGVEALGTGWLTASLAALIGISIGCGSLFSLTSTLILTFRSSVFMFFSSSFSFLPSLFSSSSSFSFPLSSSCSSPFSSFSCLIVVS